MVWKSADLVFLEKVSDMAEMLLIGEVPNNNIYMTSPISV